LSRYSDIKMPFWNISTTSPKRLPRSLSVGGVRTTGDVGRLRLTLSRDGRPRWRRTWADVRRQAEDPGWAVAVSVSRREGWTCELRADGDGHSEAEFLSPAGLVRLLNTFASHFADNRHQVIELADLEPEEAAAVGDEPRSQYRAA